MRFSSRPWRDASFARLGTDGQPTGTAADDPPKGRLLSSIADLPDRLAALPGAAGERARRLVDARLVRGRTVPPPELAGWLERTFGSVDAVREQTIVKVTNLTTLEATLFAPLRARRPTDAGSGGSDLDAEIAATEGDPFCHPETGTPASGFGRVRHGRVVTGANAALADAHHAVLVFDRHDPRAIDTALVADVLAAGRAWAERARRDDPAAGNYLLIWNCLWRAGGSIIHGHAQALLGSGPHYARIERLRRDAERYATEHRASLVEDLAALHADLGLARPASDGVVLLAHVTPIKEAEVVIVGSPGMDERSAGFVDAVGTALTRLRDRLGVTSFNLALWRPPLTGVPGPAERWPALPPIVRIVDRGDPFARSSDIGAMELYATPIVGTDPYEVVAALDG